MSLNPSRPTDGGNWEAVCTDCPYGKYTDQGAQDTCPQCGACPNGEYRTGCGTVGGSTSGQCNECDAGQFKPDSGATWVAANSPRPTDGGKWEAQCDACVEGRYQDEGNLGAEGPQGQADCKDCPKGKYDNDGTGSTQCSDCQPGFLCPNVNSSSAMKAALELTS